MVFTLPYVVGQYAVGVTTFAIPISAVDDTVRVIGNAKLKASAGLAGTPALSLEEVSFTAYYPADTDENSSTSTIRWFPEYATLASLTSRVNVIFRPLRGFLRGYAQFGEVGPWAKAIILTFGGLMRFFKVNAIHRCAFIAVPKAHVEFP